MKDKILYYDVDGPGSFTIKSEGGIVHSSPTSYDFSNGQSIGSIGNSLKREQNLQKVEHVKINHNFTVEGTSQQSTGGQWIDVGSSTLHSGQPQKGANAVNDEVYTLLTNFPDRDDGEPILVPFPSPKECMEEAEKITAQMTEFDLPACGSTSDVPQWIAAYTRGVVTQNVINKELQVKVAALIAVEKKERQIATQQKYLTEKYGEEMYIALFKAKVEQGYVYTKEMWDFQITKDDLFTSTFADGKSEKRNAFAAKIG